MTTVVRNVDFGNTTKDDLDCIEIVLGRPFQVSRDQNNLGCHCRPSLAAIRRITHPSVACAAGLNLMRAYPGTSSIVVIEMVCKRNEAAILILFGTREW
jgi:hypothetical protein